MLSTQIIVRGYHCDAYGHVNNARYLEFLEEGRWAFLQPAMDRSIFDDLGLLFVVVNINIAYKSVVVPNDVIDVIVKGMKFNNMSLQIDQEIKKGEKICAKAEVSFVLLDAKTQKPVKVDDNIQRIFNELLAL